MAKKNRSTLKGYFETGGVPSQDQYADFIDSKVWQENLGTYSDQEDDL